jgi:hypothetical protein
MVNVGFPKSTLYGFEMVDAPHVRVFAENRPQLKIYTESTHSNFSQIFGDLTSMQTLAIYPRLVVKEWLLGITRNRVERRRPGSRDVFSAPHGILARAGARAVAQGQDT